MPRFVLWSPEHLAIVAVTFVLPLVLAWWARRDPAGRRARWIGHAFSVVLVAQLLGNLVLVGPPTKDSWSEMMPLQLCHFALFAVVLACSARWRFAYEIAYFWGLAGTLQGLITPGLDYGFPTMDFICFFLGHGGIVSAVLFATAALGLRPHWASVARAFVAVLGYAALAGSFNAVFGTNYGFLAEKPAAATLLDFLGPWPWYIASLVGVAAVVFVLLYLPWAMADRWRRGPVRNAEGGVRIPE